MAGDVEPPLHERNPTGRFSERAADYVKYRPSYPAAAIDAILDGLGDPSRLSAADIGAGTGISSRLLAERGVRVFAIEPNAAMREQGSRHPAERRGARVEWCSGTAEATGLPDDSVDLVLCAQAFHWFKPALALREFARILKPKGGGARLALMWNCRDRNDPLCRGYCEALISANAECSVESTWKLEPGVVDATGLFGPVRLASFPNSQELDLPGLIGRATSASYAPKSGPDHQALVRLLTDLHNRFSRGGLVTMRYRTDVYLTEQVTGP